MFPRKKRLKRSEFIVAAKNGRRTSSPSFNVILPKDAEGYAVVVSKKTARSSVARNRIKRKTLEALRSLNLPPSLAVFPKSSVSEMKYRDIQNELENLLSKIYH